MFSSFKTYINLANYIAKYFLSTIMAATYFQKITGTGAGNRDGKNLGQRKNMSTNLHRVIQLIVRYISGSKGWY